MINSKLNQLEYRNQLSVTSGSLSKQNEAGRKNFRVNDRFILSSPINIGYFYKAYKGIDLTMRKFVTIYIKPSSKDKMFSKIIKEELKQKISPPVKWTGTQKLDKNLFDIEVHTKFGPSLEQVMHCYKKKISQTTFFLLSYHLLKLIDRIDNAGYVCRSLNLKNIIFNESCQKNDLYLLNTFDLQRKNEQSFLSYDKKYCSIGTHLRLKTCSKDTLQSISYILMDFYLKGTLFDKRIQKQKHFLQAKNTLQPDGVPIGFIQFFSYVRNLNYGQEIKFTEWKIKFKKYVQESDYVKPYEWAQYKPKNQNDFRNQRKKTTVSNFLASLFTNKFENIRQQYQGLQVQNQQFQMFQDKLQLEEEQQGQISMEQKVFKINKFTQKY